MLVGEMPDPEVHADLHGSELLDERGALAMAEFMQALSTPSRLRLLYALRDGEAGVGQLAEMAGLTPSATSQQLRILRHLRFVVARRNGRSILYRLHHGHVAALLDEVRNHLDHAAHDWAAPPAPARTPK
jgi:ArsR family transcriptional regulator, nickel/cobalt-responsive transcriptional repressor